MCGVKLSNRVIFRFFYIALCLFLPQHAKVRYLNARQYCAKDSETNGIYGVTLSWVELRILHWNCCNTQGSEFLLILYMCFSHINFRCRLYKWIKCVTAVTSYLYKDKKMTLTSFTRKYIGLVKRNSHDVIFLIFFFFSIFLQVRCGKAKCTFVLLP